MALNDEKQCYLENPLDTEQLTVVMENFLAGSPLNQVPELGVERMFARPLVGVACADDPLFARLKEPEIIGPRHLLPGEWLPGAQSVISYFLPFTEAVRRPNYSPGLPATEWVYGRIEGEMCNSALRRYLVEWFNGQGVDTFAPALDERCKVHDKRSNWSERHVAFIAGLGTFGLNKSLITGKGSAGRFGSVVVASALAATPRNYTEVYEYCNHCWQCIERCPSGAIKKEGKNVGVCSDYTDTVVKPRFVPRYGCGKCQTTVPCETGIPKQRASR